MTMEGKFILATVLTTVVIIAGAIFWGSRPEKVYSKDDLLLSNTSVLGSRDSQITLVEFSDFQCPACKMYQPIVDEIVKKYGDKIIFGYRHFPLPQHTYGEKAAIAAEAAAKQGKFWEMYNYLFLNQDTLSDDTVLSGAESIGLDSTLFMNDLKSDYIKEKVLKDKQDGARLGVNSTPTFYLNGEKLQLRTPNDLIKPIEDELQKQ
jgi:protein-disulfide isomerase